METAACAGTSGERSISRLEVIRKSQDPQSTEKKSPTTDVTDTWLCLSELRAFPVHSQKCLDQHEVTSGKILASATTIDKSGLDNLIPEVQSSLMSPIHISRLDLQCRDDDDSMHRRQTSGTSQNTAIIERVDQQSKTSENQRPSNAKAKAQHRQGWESKAVFNMGTLKELNWWTLKLSLNNPTSLIIRKPDTLLTTDASQWMWGGVCRIKKQEEIFELGKWSKTWHLTSSIQRELAAILCCLRRMEQDLMQQEVKAINNIVLQGKAAEQQREMAQRQTGTKDLGRRSTNSNINHTRLESTILEANIRQTNITESGFRPISSNSNPREAYETARLDITSGQHDSFSGFVESGENQIGERLFRECLSQKGASQQLISDVIKSWRTQWRRHAHGLTRFARYLEQQQVGIVQLLNLNTPHFFVSNWLSQIGQNESHSAVIEV
ncbi:MAG: hypothetical protein EZS28_019658 [Streblomastix strix]|uniref:Uncharacterized protein n=1 Tax=Streblomastix strix TaxID=222440 RepID=A0A5J4VRE5_9EUKA|nr:MAG: hypothetical protein EZS28_019658 [Streblomastix strix]